MNKDESVSETKDKVKKIFAKGYNNFYKLFLLFMFGCFLGDVYEVILTYLRTGELVKRQGVIYGPFNPVYGFAIVLVVIFLGKIKTGWKIFLYGALLGGSFEYLCSFIQEKFFGSISWNYSDLFLNINGRTTIPYAFFWGFLCFLLLKYLIPVLSNLIEMIPNKIGVISTWILFVFMVFNMGISVLAANRDLERHKNIPAQNELDIFLDTYYPDELMRKIFQNANFVDKTKNE